MLFQPWIVYQEFCKTNAGNLQEDDMKINIGNANIGITIADYWNMNKVPLT